MGDSVRMALVLAFPFRLAPDGRAAAVEQGSDEYIHQMISVLVQTEVGERPMCWQFGVPQPAFSEISIADVQVAIDDWGPTGIDVTDVTTTPVSDQISTVHVGWQWQEQESE